MRNAALGALVFVILALGAWYALPNASPVPVVPAEETPPLVRDEQGAAIGEENLVTFSCTEGKSITAVFERDIAALTLSDGRQITLRQAPSASGIRYLSNDATIEFRGKGTEGSLVERSLETYSSCVAQ